MLALAGTPANMAAAATVTYTSAYSGGTINPGDTVVLDNGATVTGTVAVNGTLQFNQTAALTISNTISGTGTLALTNTGTLTLNSQTGANTVVLNLNTSITAGMLLVRDSGTGILRIGSNTSGALTMSGGGITSSGGQFGAQSSGTGNATISGGVWNNSGIFYVGSGGTGLLNMSGGSITSGSAIQVAANLGSRGTATISGGTLATTAALTVGVSGSGRLTVNGGFVSSGSSQIGSTTSGNGTIAVSSGTFTTGRFEIGRSTARGVLNVTGGVVNSGTTLISSTTTATGTATVSGGTWNNSGDLAVGASGTGTLNISGSGVVIVGGTLSRGGFGTINLGAGGTLQIGTGGTTGVLGVSTLVNDGTLILNRSDAATLDTIVNGTGVVVKQGFGLLTLTAPNYYVGRTTISGGTLALSGAGSIGGGGLDLGSNGIFDLAALAAGTSTLPATGNLSGAGSLVGTGKTLAVQGSFLPGTSPGTITLGSGFTLDLSQSGTSAFEITSPLYTPGTFDRVNGSGNVIFGGVLSLIFSGGTYANGSSVLQLFANGGSRSGDFTSLEVAGLAAGQYATFNAATGSITIVPEPAAWAISLVGAGLAGLTRWPGPRRASRHQRTPARPKVSRPKVSRPEVIRA